MDLPNQIGRVADLLQLRAPHSGHRKLGCQPIDIVSLLLEDTVAKD
jgi:hypothetical protein